MKPNTTLKHFWTEYGYIVGMIVATAVIFYLLFGLIPITQKIDERNGLKYDTEYVDPVVPVYSDGDVSFM